MHELTPLGSEVYSCPFGDWQLEVPIPDLQLLGYPVDVGAVVLQHAELLEVDLEEHLVTHDVREWASLVSRLQAAVVGWELRMPEGSRPADA